MANPKEIPQQVADLIELTKRYLRQETVQPLKNIGRLIALALLSAFLIALGVVLLSRGVHGLVGEALPDGQWWSAAAAGITAVVLLLGAFGVGRRMRSTDE